jgi:hypothetical protein
LDDKLDEEVLAQHKIQTERTMKVVGAFIFALFLVALYFLLQDEISGS